MIGKFIGNMLAKPGQAPVFDRPEDYDLNYENVEFTAKDDTQLRGWLIKGKPDKVIVQSHFGTLCSRSGYTNQGKGMMKGYPRDIHFLKQAKYLNDAGYTVLMYDFRGHGESDTGPSNMVTWGPDEAMDVVAAVDFISQHESYKEAKIGLLSICMGQGASIEAFGKHGLGNRENVKAMISIQPLDYSCFINAMGLPGFAKNSTRKYLKKRTGIDYDEASWRPHVKNVSVPTLIVQNKNGNYQNEALVKGVLSDLNDEKRLSWTEISNNKKDT